MNDTGLIHIYCGNGKGKTTAAIGLIIRCIGGGGKVLFFQFLKNNSSSERNVLKNLSDITLIDGPDKIKFSKNMNEVEKHNNRIFYTKIFQQIKERVIEEGFQLLVLDEILGTISTGLLEEERLLDFLKNKPQNLEVVLTGRSPSQKIIDLANYISNIEKIKHPFDKGIAARKLIEY